MIYVDDIKTYATKGRWSHMITDGDLEELHAFAVKIGLKRDWFQPKSHPHYDVTPYMRFKAVKAGAAEVSDRELVRLIGESRSKRDLKQSETAQVADQQSEI